MKTNERPTLETLNALVSELTLAEERVHVLTHRRNEMVNDLLERHGAPTIAKAMGMTPTGIYHIRDRFRQTATRQIPA